MSYYDEHQKRFGEAYFVSLSELNPGDVISFSYKDKKRHVFVLNPKHEGKLHALELSLTPFSAIMDDVISSMYSSGAPKVMYESDVHRVAKEYDSYRTFFLKDIKKARRMPYYLENRPTLKK